MRGEQQKVQTEMQRCSDAETSHTQDNSPPADVGHLLLLPWGQRNSLGSLADRIAKPRTADPSPRALSHMISRRGLDCLVPDLVVQSREMRGPGTERARGQAGFLLLYCAWLGRLGRKQAVSSLAPRRGVHTSPRQRTEAILFIFILKLPRSSRTCDMTHHHPWPGDTLSSLSTQFCELFSSR